jgi:lysophospholipase L1-like esterase
MARTPRSMRPGGPTGMSIPSARAAAMGSGAFIPVLSAALGAVIESNTATLRNVGTAVALTISGGSYSLNGGSYSTASTTVSDGDTLKIRLTASSSNSATTSATVTIGGSARTFSVTTVGVIATPTPSPTPTPLTVLFVGSSTPKKYFTDFAGPANSQVSYSSDGVNFTTSNTVGAGASQYGDILQKALNRPIRLLATALISTKLADWEAAGNAQRANAVAVAQAAGNVDLVVSIVGFNDAYQDSGSSVSTQAAQNTRLRSFLSKLRSEIGKPALPIMIGGTQRYTGTDASGGDDKYTIVRAAELTVSADANNLFGAHAYDLTQIDGIHMDQASYLVHAARLAANTIALVNGTAREVGPTITGATAVYTTKTNVSIAHSTGTDFTPTTGLAFFQVSFDGFTTALPVTDAVRLDATTVQLTHAASGGAAPSVRAITGKAPSILGLLKDNSPRALPINPTTPVVTAAAGTSVVDPAITQPTAKSAKVNFTTSSTAIAGFNNAVGSAEVNGSSVGQTSTTGKVIALTDPSGTATGWTLTTTTASQGGNALGGTTGNNSGPYPDAVIQSLWFTGDSTVGGARIASTTHTITGLNPAKTYALDFFGARATPTERQTAYTSGGQTVTQISSGNLSTVSTITGLSPASDGSLAYTYTPAGTANFGYINALVVHEL